MRFVLNRNFNNSLYVYNDVMKLKTKLNRQIVETIDMHVHFPGLVQVAGLT